MCVPRTDNHSSTHIGVQPSYLFQKQTSTRAGFYIAKWFNYIFNKILWRNVYSEVITNLIISKKIARFYQPVKEGPQKCLYISNYPGLATFHLSSKSKSNRMFKIVFQLFNPALFSERARFCPQFTRMLCY